MIDLEALEAVLADAKPSELAALAGQLQHRAFLADVQPPKGEPSPEPEKPAEKLLTLAEVAKRLDVSEDTARRMGRRAEFAVVKVGNRVRVSEAALQRFIRVRELGR